MGFQLSDWVYNIVGKGEIAFTSNNFSFFHNVFKSCLLFMCQNEYLWSKELNEWKTISEKNADNGGYQHFLLFPQCLQKLSIFSNGLQNFGLFCNRWILITLNSLPHNSDFKFRPKTETFRKLCGKRRKYHNVFHPVKDRNHHFSYIYPVVCKCFQFGHVQNFVMWLRLNPFANKPCCSTSLLKTLWEKEKLLVTSNFSSSHSVFYQFEIVVCKLFQLGSVQNVLFGKGLTQI